MNPTNLSAVWNENDLESVPQCPICQSSTRSPLHLDLVDHLFGAPGVWNLYKCAGCTSAYLDPRPTPASLGRAYAQYYTHVGSDEPSTILKQLTRRARNGYLNRHWKTALTPSSAVLGALVSVIPSFRAKADHELMRSFPAGQPGQTLLDVGCGSGQFLALMKAAGWRVSGIDIDNKAVESARSRGLDVQYGGLELFEHVSEQFDAITLSHVIEHVYDPVHVLKDCYRLLKKGGQLWIETPNLDSEGHRLTGRNWRGLEPPRHLVLFAPDSLRALLARSGFPEAVHAPWRPLANSSMSESLAIARCEHQRLNTVQRSRQKRSSWSSLEQKAKRAAKSREYVTLLATKS